MNKAYARERNVMVRDNSTRRRRQLHLGETSSDMPKRTVFWLFAVLTCAGAKAVAEPTQRTVTAATNFILVVVKSIGVMSGGRKKNVRILQS
jgi:hypothetical protein